MFQNIEQKVEQFASKVKSDFVTDLGIAHTNLSNDIAALQEERQKVVAEAFDTIPDEAALSARLATIKVESEAKLNSLVQSYEQLTTPIKTRLYNGFENIHTKYEEILRILKA